MTSFVTGALLDEKMFLRLPQNAMATLQRELKLVR
jgi:hypothetical protein